jgi:predicted FMN-binding regulatory protein PaiB
MLIQPRYDAPTSAHVDAFVDAHILATLVTVGDDGTPHVGFYPFVRRGDGFELHLALGDPQLDDLRARPRCSVAFHRPLAFVPSHWTDHQDARHADTFHQSALFEGAADVVDDPDAVAAHMTVLLGRYQPEGGHRPFATGDDGFYAASYRRLAVVRVRVDAARTKFKVGQLMKASARENVADSLRTRGEGRDAEAAALSDEMAAPR